MRADRAAAEAMTGGQYGLVRATAAVPLAIAYALRLWSGDGTLATAGCLLAAASVAIGFRDRWFALPLIAVLIAEAADGGLAGPLGLTGFFVLHTTVRGAPYGSLDARGRIDPAGGWSIAPRWVRRAWRLLGLIALLRSAEMLAADSPAATTFALTTALAGLVAFRGRPDAGLWLVLATLLVAGNLLVPTALAPLAVTTGLVATVSPAWFPPAVERGPFTLFYDGACGLCHRTVRFLLAEDRAGVFSFAPLGGPTFLDRVPPDSREGLPDSMVLQTADGALLVGATSVLAAGRALGGWWRAGANVASRLPDAVLDAAYGVLARSRRHVFRRPDAVCPMLPDALRGRFPDLTA